MSGKRDYGRLQIPPDCLVFLIDETGHEEFADSNYPVFGLGGCCAMAGAIDRVIKGPWRAMKKAHFGGESVPLHAADLRNPTPEQLQALGDFFASNPFGRFAVTITGATSLPAGIKPYDVMPAALRKRVQDLVGRSVPTPREIALLHEESERGDELVQRYFGTTVAEVNGVRVPVHHGFMPKRVGDEAMEVADFVVQAAGRQAHNRSKGGSRIRKDFASVFHANQAWSSFVGIEGIEGKKPDAA